MHTSLLVPRNPTEESGFFDRRPRLLMVTMVVLFAMAGAIRLYRLDAPGLLIERDYRSAILARSFYFEHVDSIQQWRRDIALATARNQRTLEPPATEFLVSLLYRAVGGEEVWIARLLTCSFWLIGGIFIYKIAASLFAAEAAVVVTGYYSFAPLGILLSRSLAPDSLMMTLFLISLYSVIRYHEEPSDYRLVTAACISALALLYRPQVAFIFLGAFTVLTLNQAGGWKGLVNRRFLIFMAISLCPSVLYYGHGILFNGSLGGAAQRHFRPYLLLHREFWRGWLELSGWAVGRSALIGALIGATMLHKGLPRALVSGLGIGYVVFGLVFTMNIHTHGYYHAVLIPIVAISLGPLVALVSGQLGQTSGRWYWRLPVLGALILALSFSFLEVRSRVGSQVFESAETAWEIGEIVNHSSKVVWVARHYGQPLQYNGELTGAPWPRRITYWLHQDVPERELTIDQRMDALGFAPEYFVITDFGEFEKNHADLREYLTSSCSFVAESDQYLIYNNCELP